MSLRITLIEPTRYGMDGTPRKSRRILVPTMTLPYLAALTPPEFSVRIVQDAKEDINFEDRPDLVGITAVTLHVRRAYAIADEFRTRGVPVVMGGVHATLNPEEARAHADTLILGEAELSWPRFLRDFAAGVPRPLYEAERPPTLEGLPVPRWDLLRNWDTSQFCGLLKFLTFLTAPRTILFRPIVTVQTSRGCATNCDYCTVTKFFGARTRYRPVGEIVEEINALGARFVFLTDDNLFASADRARELFTALQPLRLKWIGFAPIAVGEQPELLELARASGCLMLLLGIESLSGESLTSVNKKINRPEDYSRNLAAIRRAKIVSIALFMLGFDNEGSDAISRTHDFIMANRIPVVIFSTLTPYPGTRVYERLKGEGKLYEEAWWLKKGRPVNALDFICPGSSPEEFYEEFYHHYRRVYSLKGCYLRAAAAPPRVALPIFFLNLYLAQRVRRRFTSLVD